MNSETPLTDEEAYDFTPAKTEADEFYGNTPESSEVVNADFARRLELRCKRLEEALTRIRDGALVSSAQSNPHFNPKWIAYEALADQQEEKP